jgi:uncharacterized protein (DUF983 family)
MRYGAVSPLSAGLRCRCPRCGVGKLYSGLLTVAPRCSHCGLDLSAQDSGDGPAVFVILFVGAIAVAAALAVELTYSPPTWVHLVYEIPLVSGLSILLLRPFKATLIAYQYRHKTPGFETD